MDFETAVDKVNSMPAQEIIEIANELPCLHVAKSARECIISNVLSHLTGIPNNRLSVNAAAATCYNEDGTEIEKEWEPHISKIILDFDENPSDFVNLWASEPVYKEWPKP